MKNFKFYNCSLGAYQLVSKRLLWKFGDGSCRYLPQGQAISWASGTPMMCKKGHYCAKATVFEIWLTRAFWSSWNGNAFSCICSRISSLLGRCCKASLSASSHSLFGPDIWYFPSPARGVCGRLVLSSYWLFWVLSELCSSHSCPELFYFITWCLSSCSYNMFLVMSSKFSIHFSMTLDENFWEHRVTKWGANIFSILWFWSKLFIWIIFWTM